MDCPRSVHTDESFECFTDAWPLQSAGHLRLLDYKNTSDSN